MPKPYFAYGSNLCEGRLRRRVPSVRRLGVGQARDYRLRWHKRGRDGSGKCSIEEGEPGSSVWGALFHVSPGERPLLDRVEGLGRGYEEVGIRVEVDGRSVEAWTYRAQPEWVDDALRPFAWYRDLVVGGARAFGLPDAYVARLERMATVPDPDRERAARNVMDLGGGA